MSLMGALSHSRAPFPTVSRSNEKESLSFTCERLDASVQCGIIGEVTSVSRSPGRPWAAIQDRGRIPWAASRPHPHHAICRIEGPIPWIKDRL